MSRSREAFRSDAFRSLLFESLAQAGGRLAGWQPESDQFTDRGNGSPGGDEPLNAGRRLQLWSEDRHGSAPFGHLQDFSRGHPAKVNAPILTEPPKPD